MEALPPYTLAVNRELSRQKGKPVQRAYSTSFKIWLNGLVLYNQKIFQFSTHGYNTNIGTGAPPLPISSMARHWSGGTMRARCVAPMLALGVQHDVLADVNRQMQLELLACNKWMHCLLCFGLTFIHSERAFLVSQAKLKLTRSTIVLSHALS